MTAKITDINKNFRFFKIDGSKRQRMIDLSAICIVTTVGTDNRNKKIITVSGEKIILINYRLEKLLNSCSQLIQVNRHTLLSPAIVKEKDNKFLYLNIKEKGSPIKVILSREYKNEMKKLIG